jgi:hypothetical protein
LKAFLEIIESVVSSPFVKAEADSVEYFYVTEYGTALTTILPILFLYLNTVTVTAGTFEP